MTTYVWSAVVQGEDKPVVKRRTTQVLSVLPLDPQDAAATVFKWWLENTADDTDSSNWDYEFGDPENTEVCHVVIHEPAEAAGCYEVHAERALTVRGYMAEESDAQRVLAVIDEREAAP